MAKGGQANRPVGQGNYVIQTGESIGGLAAANGLSWEKLWNDPGNAEVKRVRKHPGMIQAGDRLHIPPKQPKTVTVAAKKKHRFRRVGVPAPVRLQFHAFGQARKGEKYELEVDGKIIQKGKLDAKGGLEAPVPPDSRKATVYLGDTREAREVDLGAQSPN